MIDSHAHLISADRGRYPPNPLSGTLAPDAYADPITVERLIALMDEHGIERSLAVQRAHIYGFDNSYICDAAARYPERLRALPMIDALKADARQMVRYWVRERGAVGIRMTEPAKGSDPSWFASREAFAAWETVSELGGSVRLHFYRWNRLACLAALKSVLRSFPQTTVVLDHFSNIAGESGAPDHGVDEALLEMVPHANVFLLYSMINLGKLAAMELPSAPVVERVVREFGANRVMWGSDLGQSKGTYADMVRLAHESTAGLSEIERRQVLHDTGQSVYWGK